MSGEETISGTELALLVPVVVRAELGSIELTAADWAEVEPGDVLMLGQPLASPIQLRIGGRAVARAELVAVDGELGVRILGLEPNR